MDYRYKKDQAMERLEGLNKEYSQKQYNLLISAERSEWRKVEESAGSLARLSDLIELERLVLSKVEIQRIEQTYISDYQKKSENLPNEI